MYILAVNNETGDIKPLILQSIRQKKKQKKTHTKRQQKQQIALILLKTNQHRFKALICDKQVRKLCLFIFSNKHKITLY